MKAVDYAPPGPLDHEPAGAFVPFDQRAQALFDAFDGVEVGVFDRRIIRWLATADNATVRTVVSLVLRARAAGGDR